MVEDKQEFLEDIVKFWDTYLDYTDEEFAQYQYEFPLRIEEIREEKYKKSKIIDLWNLSGNESDDKIYDKPDLKSKDEVKNSGPVDIPMSSSSEVEEKNNANKKGKRST